MGIAEAQEAIRICRGSDRSFFVGPRDAALVEAAESALGVTFPPEYRLFVSELGAGSIGSREFYGVIDDDFENSSVPDAIWLTLSERDQLAMPEELVIVSEDGLGNYYVLNALQADASGDCPVLLWTPGDLREGVAPDFGTFMLRAIREQFGAV